MAELLYCNENKNIYALELKCRISIGDYSVETVALIDTGSTKTIIDPSLIPLKYQGKTSEKTIGIQMDGKPFIYDTIIKSNNAHIQFYNTCKGYKEKYNLGMTWIRELNHDHKFILGLNFIFENTGGLHIAKDILTISKDVTQVPIITKCCENCKKGKACKKTLIEVDPLLCFLYD